MTLRHNPARKQGEARGPHLNLTLDSTVSSADVAESAVIEFCASAGYGERQCGEIGLAVREAVVNAVCHGNHEDMTKKVVLIAAMEDRGLVVSIRDEGEGFDPATLPDPLVADNLLNESGRGYFLLKTCMDDVAVRRITPRGTELVMIKSLSKLPKEVREVSLKASNRQVDGVTVVDLSGRIVLGEGSEILRDTLRDLISQGHKKILLNLGDVNYSDSSGLGALVSGYTSLTSQGGHLKVLNLTKKVHDLLQVTKLLTIFEVFDDEATALKSYS